MILQKLRSLNSSLQWQQIIWPHHRDHEAYSLSSKRYWRLSEQRDQSKNKLTKKHQNVYPVAKKTVDIHTHNKMLSLTYPAVVGREGLAEKSALWEIKLQRTISANICDPGMPMTLHSFSFSSNYMVLSQFADKSLSIEFTQDFVFRYFETLDNIFSFLKVWKH